jgi:hypothetical protein
MKWLTPGVAAAMLEAIHALARAPFTYRRLCRYEPTNTFAQ